MSKNNNATSKKSNNQVANVPNPPVPNRAHTEMKKQNNSLSNTADSKNSSSSNRAENKTN